MKLTDQSIIYFGKYKGEKMIKVPATYLIDFFESNELLFERELLPKKSREVMEYIEKNKVYIQAEIKKELP